MPTFKLTRTPEGALDGTDYIRLTDAETKRRAARTGKAYLECYSGAAEAVCKANPQAYADHQDLIEADRNPLFREKLRGPRPDLYAAITDRKKADELAVRTQTPERLSADQVYANAADRVVEDEMGGDRSRLPEAFDVVGKRQPELLHNYLAQRNGMPAAESFADPNFPREDVGAVTMDVLSDLVSGLSTKDARATLLVMVKEGKSAFVLPALEAAGVSLEPLKAAHARLELEISPATRIIPGGGGETETVASTGRHSALGNPDHFASVQSAGAWSEPFAEYVEGQPFRIMPLGSFTRDGRKLELTPARLKAIAQNYENGVAWLAPIYAGHPSEGSDPPSLGHVAKLEYRNGKGLYAYPAFTEEGARLAQSGAFLYNSPGIIWSLNNDQKYVDLEGNEWDNVLDHVAMTSKPAFGRGNTLE